MLFTFSSLHVIKLTKLLTHSNSTECKLKMSWIHTGSTDGLGRLWKQYLHVNW